jgi:cytochrome c oxidase accessory protein FixG
VSNRANIEQDKFRDSIATADHTGKRIWVFPSKPKGRLYSARNYVAVLLLGFLFAAPFIKLGGQPLLLLDILERRFIIFGLPFWPQDFHLFVLATITVAVFVILFTAIFGRLFCGWMCPQTVFMEMVFRRIEYWIDGGPAKQRQLTARKWDEVKFFKRLFKHGIFCLLSFIIGNTFLAYFVGIDALYDIVTDPPGEHIAGLTAMVIFSFLFYGVFAWFREQACTLVCPYGRLQGVLIDKNSIVVAYDHVRGEPRGPMDRSGERVSVGDCVECDQCVAVCPTGIDIRNGTQLECVNCTACIDACNRTMRKVNLPEGLVRYSSEEAIEGGSTFRMTGRILIYSIVFTILTSILTFLLVTRTDIETTILRTPGTLFQETETGVIRNLYTVKIVNKTFEEIPVHFRLQSPTAGSIVQVGPDLIVDGDGLAESAFFVDIPRKSLFSTSSLIIIEVMNGDKIIEEINSRFMGPR